MGASKTQKKSKRKTKDHRKEAEQKKQPWGEQTLQIMQSEAQKQEKWPNEMENVKKDWEEKDRYRRKPRTVEPKWDP